MTTASLPRCPTCLYPLREHCKGQPPPGSRAVGCDCWFCTRCRLFGVLTATGKGWRWSAIQGAML